METIKLLIDKALVNLLEAGDLWNDLNESEWNQVNESWTFDENFDDIIHKLMEWKENM
jgi:hypothetical protein